MDDRLLYQELLETIHKKGQERLGEEVKDPEIRFSIHSLMSSLDDVTRRYETAVMEKLRSMVSHGSLTQSGSPPVYSTTEKFYKEYEKNKRNSTF